MPPLCSGPVFRRVRFEGEQRRASARTTGRAAMIRSRASGAYIDCPRPEWPFHEQGRIRMRIGTLFLVTIACAALISCSSPGMLKANYVRGGPNPFVTSVTCPAQDCSVEVKVIWDAAQITPVVRTFPIISMPAWEPQVSETSHGKSRHLATNSRGNRINSASSSRSDPDDEFKNVQITGSGTSLSVQFKNQRPRMDYAYVLALRQATGTKKFCETLDPWIIS